METNFITFNNVSFRYNGAGSFLLSDYSFELSFGSRMVIKGESGSGKTTIFRLLLGFETPDNGEIRYRDQLMDPNVAKQMRKETVWLPQDLNLGAGPLKEVFYHPFKFEANTSRKPSRDTVLSVFNLLGMDNEVWKTDFTDLSTGQRQRVGLALCHLLDKPLMLLDEPTSALDERSKQRVIDLLFADTGRTILSTSHDPWWIARCDKVVALTN